MCLIFYHGKETRHNKTPWYSTPMNKYIALLVAVLAIAGGIFLMTKKVAAPENAAQTAPAAELNLPMPPVLSFTHIIDTPVAIEAWETFVRYRTFAKAHDLAG